MRREIITDYPRRSNLIISFHIWEARESEPERRHVKTGAEIGIMLPHTKEPKADKGKERCSPRDFIGSLAQTTPSF